jgi:ubiquinone/menaquinone biosynthesis C-methylase UbiE
LSELERIIEEKLEPVYKAHYAIWVYWWPLWRSLYSGRKILKKWEHFGLVRQGQTFLDYGCGTGFFTIAASRIVGENGKVYALDCFSRQLDIVVRRTSRKGLTNIETILSDNETGLPDECIDVVWMCDVFHEVQQRRAVLEELHRVLKKEGVVAIYDGMGDKVLGYTEDLFTLIGREGKLLTFTR